MKSKESNVVLPEPVIRDKNRNSYVPKICDIVGAGLKHIGPYKRLDNTKQVVALINDVRTPCILLNFQHHLSHRRSSLGINIVVDTIVGYVHKLW